MDFQGVGPSVLRAVSSRGLLALAPWDGEKCARFETGPVLCKLTILEWSECILLSHRYFRVIYNCLLGPYLFLTVYIFGVRSFKLE